MRTHINRFILFLFFVFVFNGLVAQNASSYEELIVSADNYFNKHDYYNAKTTYEFALQKNPSADYAKKRIAEIIDLLNNELEIRIIYEDQIQLAEAAYAAKNYEKAIEYYTKASQTIAYEESPKKQLTKIRQEWEDLKIRQKNFEALIAVGKQAKQNQDFQLSLKNYEEANLLFPSNSEVLAEIATLKMLLKQQSAKQDEFTKLIADGDKRMSQDKYTLAFNAYENALKLFPKDSYAKNQLQAASTGIKKENDFNAQIEKGDAFYVALNMTEARKAYEAANLIWPEKSYPLNMLSKIEEAADREVADLERMNAEYLDRIESGDKDFNNEKYELAYDSYLRALNIKPDEVYPQAQIQKINKLLAKGYIDVKCDIHEMGRALADIDLELVEDGVSESFKVGSNGKYKLKLKFNKNYVLTFSKAGYIHKIFAINTNLPNQDLLNTVFNTDLSVELFKACSIDLSFFDQPMAEIAYQSASEEFTYDARKVQSTIKRAEELKQACAKSLAEQKIIEEYESLLTKAEELASAEDYLAAIELFQKASNLFRANPLPKERIKAINNLLNAQAAYADLIKTGDANYASGKFNDALFSYYKAKNLKPKESYPQERIDEIDKILMAQKAEDELFQAQLRKADSLFDSKHWGESISIYEPLLAQKSSNKHIQDRLENARKYFLAEKVLNEKYSKAISEADEYFDKQSFAEAKKAYLLANQLKPNDPYPLYKIEDINTITEQQDIRTTNNRYREVIDQADKNFNQQALSQALTLYQQATTIKPNESYPKDQIAKINLILAQKELLENQYKKAIQSADSAFYLESYAYARLRYVKANQLKAEEAYPPAQIQKIDALLNDLNTQEANYNAAILRADESFKLSNYNPAKVDYQIALNIKPQEEYPANKIKEIELILANLSAMEAKEAAYQKAIQSADSAFSLESYAIARLHYVNANHLKAEETYPPAQIQKIDALLASLNATEVAYQKAIRSADSAFSLESYAFARFDYVKANRLKAEEIYPPAQIQKIDALLNALNTQEANYNAAILRADASFGRNEYGSAKADYQMALSIKPKEVYPANKIKEIENILANLSAREAAYQKAIQEGDQDFSAKRFSLAIKNFNEAIRIKENESYPKERIKAIEDYLAEMEKINLAYADLIRRADGEYQNQNYQEAIAIYQESNQLKLNEKYPPDQIARINGILANQKILEESYKTAIAKADQLFAATDYQQSLTFYQQANQLKPIEKYPLQQMERIRTLLGSSRKEYEAYILKGDDAYQKSIFQDAILAYESALGIFPDEAYPRSMLDKIEAKIRRESVVSLVSIPEVITAGTEKRYAFSPIDYRDRQNNYILIEMKNNTAKQMRVFISFGKNGSKNGGYSVNLIQRDGYTKYFVSIDRQLRWISEDNNWLSLLPEGGDLEVNIIQISREEKK